ncbi:putative glycosyltransferase [Monocercomonoides exilis]|uniref:putative glycosyltransferase n=1 Tax=Monocercomonoides exilis TaxID=2049356 RepID=UPI003559F04A|nr:putative glycosyltransferase [Monocercomonoides exilis]|eukprot:MONOS_13854.1-p1 / transcript=MONOS_13854.1 / gene=MONOS_13854 / organism=Monocercomonoides_exilis_PA203 / gene_product=glycosyltransferase / transcript_product=glycosyltransferase / location=Mono_scaffold00894:7427-8296(+) / protein_length=289 / sequence_SO=supercontig / SO=protein_coding / is_pseudo=false
MKIRKKIVAAVLCAVAFFFFIIWYLLPRLGDKFNLYPPFNSKFQKCVKQKAPRVTRILETAQYLSLTNKSLARFGDGEVALILNQKLPFQDPNPELGKRLEQVFVDELPDLLIGIPDVFSWYPPMSERDISFWNDRKRERKWILNHIRMDRQYYASHSASPYENTIGTYCELLPQVYATLRDIWRGKDIVIVRGNNSQVYKYDIYDTARSRRIFFVPSKQAWSEYENIKSTLLKEDPSNLFILAVGPLSKVLAYDLVKAGRRALDMGHLAKDYNAWKQNSEIDISFFFD